DHEQHRHQVELGRYAQATGTCGDDAGLKGFVLAAAPGFAAEQAGGAKHEGAESEDSEKEDCKSPIMGQAGDFAHAGLLTGTAENVAALPRESGEGPRFLILEKL